MQDKLHPAIGSGLAGDHCPSQSSRLTLRKLTWSRRRGWWRQSRRCWQRQWNPHLRRRSGLSCHWEERRGACYRLGPALQSLFTFRVSDRRPPSQQGPSPHCQDHPICVCPVFYHSVLKAESQENFPIPLSRGNGHAGDTVREPMGSCTKFHGIKVGEMRRLGRLRESANAAW